MGAQSSCDTSANTLHALLAQWVDEAIQLKAFTLLRDIAPTCLMVDDLLTQSRYLHKLRYIEESHSYLEKELGANRWVTIRGIFPRGGTNGQPDLLKLNIEGELGKSKDVPTRHPAALTFLDLTIEWRRWWQQQGRLTYAPHDRRRLSKYDIALFRRLTDARSLVPEQHKSGVLGSELTRAASRCLKLNSFVFEAASMMLESYLRGHKFDKLVTVLNKRLHRLSRRLWLWRTTRTRIRSRILCAVRTLWRDGLPLVQHRNKRLGFPTPLITPQHPPL